MNIPAAYLDEGKAGLPILRYMQVLTPWRLVYIVSKSKGRDIGGVSMANQGRQELIQAVEEWREASGRMTKSCVINPATGQRDNAEYEDRLFRIAQADLAHVIDKHAEILLDILRRA